jgi:prepilin-type N-terminal cleavage/methylation domain-containing protein
MMDLRRRQALRGEDGFTLVELLVVMVISTVVLLGTLLTLDSFSSNSIRQTRIIDANEQVRTTMDRVVRDLRDVATITRAGANDLVYSLKESVTTTRYERICMDSAGGIWGSQSTTAPDPGTGCPTAASGWSGGRITLRASTNSTANPIFRYDNSNLAAVRSIGLTFSLDAKSGGRPGGSTLRASAFVRNRVERAPVVTTGDIAATCTPSGPLLNFGLVNSLLNGPLSISYADQSGVLLGSGSNVQLTNAVSRVVATVTNAIGLTTVVTKDLKCN